MTKKKLKAVGWGFISKKRIWRMLKEIQEINMFLDGSSYACDAVYRDMRERCIYNDKNFNKTKDFVNLPRFKLMLKRYRRNLINSPHDYGVEPFNVLARLMAVSSEC